MTGGTPHARPYPAGPSPQPDTGGVQEPRLDRAALALLQLQADMRKAKSRTELGYFIANEARAVLRAQQVIVVERGLGKSLLVHTISSVTRIDRSSPLVLWLESILKALEQTDQLDTLREFEAGAYAGAFDAVQRTYPLRHMLWVPWPTLGPRTSCGMMLTRTTPWSDQDFKIASYLAGAFGHGWASFDRPLSLSIVGRLASRRSLGILGFVAAALLLLPVPMTALAPVEIGPRETFIVTPGVDGFVQSVDIEPNAEVKSGQRLVTLNDTILRNRAEIAEREVVLADSKYKKSAQLAFVDVRGRHEMAIAKSELDLKLAERDFAHELLRRTQIKSERAGVAFFADKKDLVGKPVSIGEKLMEVANPAATEFRIELPAADAIVLAEGARVKVFLDSDPLNAIEAKLVRASYKAASREAQQFSFRLVAAATFPDAATFRLGMRGTAQIYGSRVPLGFYLFRRPIAALRQWSGL